MYRCKGNRVARKNFRFKGSWKNFVAFLVNFLVKKEFSAKRGGLGATRLPQDILARSPNSRLRGKSHVCSSIASEIILENETGNCRGEWYIFTCQFAFSILIKMVIGKYSLAGRIVSLTIQRQLTSK